MKKLFLKWFPILLSILLCFEAGCAKVSGNQETQQAFSEYTDQLFRSEVSASTLNMHYCLAHPENFGITEYPITYGTVSQESSGESAVLLENWRKKLEGFKKKELTISQQLTYDIMMDYIDKELPATEYGLYSEILRPSTGFQSQLPVLLAEHNFNDDARKQSKACLWRILQWMIL